VGRPGGVAIAALAEGDALAEDPALNVGATVVAGSAVAVTAADALDPGANVVEGSAASGPAGAGVTVGAVIAPPDGAAEVPCDSPEMVPYGNPPL
jgi:hypothetical protein